jgi:kinesin family protein 18/19
VFGWWCDFETIVVCRAGKTHTMLGNSGNPGLTFLTVMELYRRLGEMDSDYETEVAVSYLEVR